VKSNIEKSNLRTTFLFFFLFLSFFVLFKMTFSKQQGENNNKQTNKQQQYPGKNNRTGRKGSMETDYLVIHKVKVRHIG